MSLTLEDLLKIEHLFDRKFDQKFDEKFDEKFAPIKADINILKDQMTSVLTRLDREELSFIVKKVDEVELQTKSNTNRIEKIELKVFGKNDG